MKDKQDIFVAVGKAVITVAVFGVVAFLFTYPVMWAMNYTFSSWFLGLMFGVTKMTFWKTFVASWVIGALVKGMK